MSKLIEAPPAVDGFSETLPVSTVNEMWPSWMFPSGNLSLAKMAWAAFASVDAPSVSLAVVKMPVSRGKSLEKPPGAGMRPPF
jgi:hypothetical protein